MSSIEKSYTYTPEALKFLSQNKPFILFDSSSIIRIAERNALGILEDIKKNECELAYIHPVLVEIMNAKAPGDRTERQNLIGNYDLLELPMQSKYFTSAKVIQEQLISEGIQPSPTDLYLAGVLATHANNIYLMTENLKDFPKEFFPRYGFVVIQDDRHANTSAFIGIDKEKLKL